MGNAGEMRIGAGWIWEWPPAPEPGTYDLGHQALVAQHGPSQSLVCFLDILRDRMGKRGNKEQRRIIAMLGC